MLRIKKKPSLYFLLLISAIGTGNCSTLNDITNHSDTSVKTKNLSKINSAPILVEPTFCDKTISQITSSENLEDIYDAAEYFMREKHNYKVAITLYSKALEIDTNSSQTPITKTYLASCYLKSDESLGWRTGADYLIDAAPHYDIAHSFISWLKRSFSLEKDILKMPKEQAVDVIIKLREQHTNPTYWNIDPS